MMKRPLDKKLLKFYGWVWLALLLLGLLGELAQHQDDFGRRTLNSVWGIMYVAVLSYFLFEYTLPWLSWKRTGRSILLVFAYLMLCSFGLYGWRWLGVGLHLYPAAVAFPTPEHKISDQTGHSMASLIFFGVARHIYNYIKLKQDAQKLLIEKQQAELNYLKSQTNPHFLFNTLNNIYSLARDKSDRAAESIMRLSKILRFMLYESGGPYIAIEHDLKIIGDYIELEKLRYDESLRVNFNYDVEDMKQALPPLLLIPLVENAFKHGAAETRDRPFVDIHLSVKNRQLAFYVRNSFDGPAETEMRESIGLSNLRRQLELLYTDYDLSVQQEGSVFTATLKINLASHV